MAVTGLLAAVLMAQAPVAATADVAFDELSRGLNQAAIERIEANDARSGMARRSRRTGCDWPSTSVAPASIASASSGHSTGAKLSTPKRITRNWAGPELPGGPRYAAATYTCCCEVSQTEALVSELLDCGLLLLRRCATPVPSWSIGTVTLTAMIASV